MTGWLKKGMRWGVLFVMVLSGGLSFGQELSTSAGHSFKDNWAVQLQPAFSQFYGDASNHNYFQKFTAEIDFAANLNVRKMIIPAIGVGFDVGYAGLASHKDQKANGTKVNLTLGGNFYDAGLFVYLNFNHLFAGYKPDRHFTVYGTLGAGWSFWNSWLTDGITGLTIYSGSTIGGRTYKTNAFVVPVGLGVNWRFANHWTASLGGTLRTVFSDDVDVWHDGFKYDQIFTTQLGITYHIRPGWGRGGRSSKKKEKKNPCCNEKNQAENKPVVPIYDFDQVNMLSAPVKTGKPTVAEPEKVPSKPAKAKSPAFEFRVQILATSKPLPDVSSLRTRYHLPYAVTETHQDGLYRYSVGSFQSYSAAVEAAQKIKNRGIFDAFVVAYRNGLRIALTPEMKKEKP